MAEFYPVVDAFDQGMLDVGDGNLIYWEAAGNPAGKPAVVLHGGPGQGSSPNMRRGFDPGRYLVVMLDQRGCGRSVPHASDHATDMSVNTTWHLVADIERLREHLGIERWLVCGGSWGSTLGLAYAQAHPDRVTEVVLTAITTSRRSETDWLYSGAAMFFPEAHERFVAAAGCGLAEDASPLASGKPGRLAEAIYAAYVRALADPDLDARVAAALAWREWEDTVLSLEPTARPGGYPDGSPADLLAFVRLCAWYAMHGAWLDDRPLIAGAGRLAGLPGVLIHGRQDLSCPAATAWELARAWPGARLLIDDTTGHLGGPGIKRRWLVEALDGFLT